MSDTTSIILILAALAAALFVIATRLSEAMVRFRARRLPPSIGLRMEEEWLGELSTISSRPGKLAFAIALIFTRRQAFAAPGEFFMPEIRDHHGFRLIPFNGRKTLLISTTLFFAVAAYGASYLLPVRYESQSLILLSKPDVSWDLLRGLPEESRKDQVPALLQLVQSRTILVSIAREFGFRIGRKDDSMDHLVERLRNDIRITFTPSTGDVNASGSVIVRYLGNDPESAQKVAQKLTLLLIQEDNRSRESRFYGTKTFLQGQLNELAERVSKTGELLAQQRAAHGSEARITALDYDELVSRYKTLFSKYEDAQTAVKLENQQKGANLEIIDPANRGTPVTPSRLAIAGIGALVGLLIGATAILGSQRRQRQALA